MSRARVDEHLLDVRQGLERLRAAGGRVDGQHAKAGDLELLALDLRGEHAARFGGPGGVAIQEHEAGGELGAELEACLRGRGAQEARRGLDQQTTAVARLAVGGDRAPMGQAVQRADRRLHAPNGWRDRRGSRSGRIRRSPFHRPGGTDPNHGCARPGRHAGPRHHTVPRHRAGPRHLEVPGAAPVHARPSAPVGCRLGPGIFLIRHITRP